MNLWEKISNNKRKKFCTQVLQYDCALYYWRGKKTANGFMVQIYINSAKLKIGACQLYL